MEIIFKHPSTNKEIKLIPDGGFLWLYLDGEGMRINSDDFYFMLEKWFKDTM